MAIPEELRETVFFLLQGGGYPGHPGAHDGGLGWGGGLSGGGRGDPARPESKRHGLWLGVMLAETLDRYDNRGGQAAGQLRDNPAFRRALTQLKLTEPEA